MDQFTEWLGNFMDKPVVNSTGLKGYYDFSLKLSPQDFQTMFIFAAMAGGSNIPPEIAPKSTAFPWIRSSVVSSRSVSN